MGSVSGIIIPNPVLAQLGIEDGDILELALEGGRVVLVPVKGHLRAGWTGAAQEIAANGDDALMWPEFGNACDEDLRW